MSRNLAATVGGAAGAVALVGIIIVLIWFCLFHKSSVSRNSDTGSSDPSQGNNNILASFLKGGSNETKNNQILGFGLNSIHAVGRHGGLELTVRDARRFEIEELSQATKNFSDKNLIGEGKFGEVYRGLLHDGMLVVIKKRHGFPSQEFVDEVHFLSSIQHRNLVTLLGYCQENNLQFLIYEYVPNGSVYSHLYGAGQQSREKLEFKHRLSIALGAAKGLAHLHSLSPRLVHKDFKTANVLVDENFIPKVADAGLRNFLGRVEIAGPSSQVAVDEIFLAPEVREFRRFSEKSDVYSFGVFLLELLSGREAIESPSPDSNQNLVEWVQSKQEPGIMSNIVDERMGINYTEEGMEEFMSLIVPCIDTSSERRPTMSYVAMEMDRILEKERNLTTVMGEGTPIVTLGSQLFKSTK